MATNLEQAECEAMEPIAAALFEEHLQPVFGYLVRLLGDRELAEKVAAATMAVAQRASDELPGIVDRRAWLYGLATGNALHSLRKAQSGWRPGRRAPWRREKSERLAENWSPDELARNEAVEKMLLLALPPEHRAPLLLYGHNRLNLAEVASALHTTEDIARAMLYEARLRFRQAYDPGVQGAGHGEFKEQLAVYDSLGREQQAKLDRHVFACLECAAELALYRRMDRALHRLPDARPGEELEAEVHAWVSKTRRSQTPAPVHRPKLNALPPPPPPEPASTPEPDGNAPPDSPARPQWTRLALPVAIAFLFAGSVWAGMRGESQPRHSQTEKVTTPVATSGTVQNLALPVRPTEAPSAIDAAGRVTVTFACDDVAPYRKLGQAFEAENQDVTVQLRNTAEVVSQRPVRSASLGSRSSLDTGVALAARTDAFCTTNDPALLMDGLVRDLAPVAKADDSFAIDQIYPEVVQRATIAGSLYMIPARFQPEMIQYDQAAFATAGLRPPRPGWSWDDLLSAAAALTKRDGASTRRWGFGQSDGPFLLARFFSATASPLAAGSLESADPFANPEVHRLFGWFNSLYLQTRAAPVPATVTTEADRAASPAPEASRDAAMWTASSGAAPPPGIRMVPFPVARPFDKTTPIGQVRGWAISSEAAHVDAAWRWISYISQNLPASSHPLEVPARRSVSEMQAFWKGVPAADGAAYEYALDHLASWPDMAQVPGMLPLYTKLVAMIRGDTTLTALMTGDAAREPAPVQPSDVVTLTLAAPGDHMPD